MFQFFLKKKKKKKFVNVHSLQDPKADVRQRIRNHKQPFYWANNQRTKGAPKGDKTGQKEG